MSGWPFDGAHEIDLKLERGASFGLTKAQYGALAQVSMGALRMGGVEPCEIGFLHNEVGDIIPGCNVTLFGRQNVYTIRMEPGKLRTSLYFLPLDSKLGGPGCALHVHEWSGLDFAGATLTHILAREGVPLMSWEDVEEWHRQQEY